MKRTLLAAVLLALSAPAAAYSYYLVPGPYVHICDPGEYLSVYRVLPQTEYGHGGVLHFLCFHGAGYGKSYVGLEVSLEDAGTIFVEPRYGDWVSNDGWFRVTYNIVPGSVTATDNGRQF